MLWNRRRTVKPLPIQCQRNPSLKTIVAIVSTLSQEEALALASIAVVMNEGKVEQIRRNSGGLPNEALSLLFVFKQRPHAGVKC